MSRNKFNARKTEIDGITFDSKGEAKRYVQLKVQQNLGYISDLELQPKFTLQSGFKCPVTGTHRAITYKADFKYTEDGQTVVEDYKGMKTEVFKIKWKLAIAQNPGIVFRLTKG